MIQPLPLKKELVRLDVWKLKTLCSQPFDLFAGEVKTPGAIFPFLVLAQPVDTPMTFHRIASLTTWYQIAQIVRSPFKSGNDMIDSKVSIWCGLRSAIPTSAAGHGPDLRPFTLGYRFVRHLDCPQEVQSPDGLAL
jgi:hypothetical protein